VTAPIVSAVMAVYNGERFVAEAIESMLSQTRPPDQVIVVDDGSTDRTAEIVRGFASVEYVHQPNAGRAALLSRRR